MGVTIGIDLRCIPRDGSVGAGIAHAARELSCVLATHPEVTWKTYPQGISLRRALRGSPCDVLFVPSGAVSLGLSVSAIPWVHDLAIYEHPGWFPQNFLKRALTTFLFRRGVQRASRVLAVSQDTKDAIVRRFHVDPSRITVTMEGGDPALAALDGEALQCARSEAKARVMLRGIRQPYVLALGTLEPRKNLAMLIRACPFPLVIAGRDGWKFDDVNQAIKNALHVHRIPTCSDEEKRDLLLAADVVAVPSLHEGFGLVALEAMQAGVAVVASDRGALPEIVGDMGVLLPPMDERAWKETLCNMMSDAKKRESLAEKGKLRSKNMTWEKTAEVVLDALLKT